MSTTAEAGIPVAPRRVALLGAGAVGTLLGGLLASAGADVVLVDPWISADAGDEVVIHEPDGRRVVVRVGRAATPAALAAAPDLAVLAVKTFDLAGALDDLRAWPGTPVLTIQNGVGAEDLVTAARPGVGHVAGSLTAPVEREGAHEVRWRGRGGIALAPVAGPVGGLRDELVGMFARAGLPARKLDDPRAMKWSKLVANLVGNALSALVDRDPGEIYADPVLFDLERRQLLEALAVMHAQGIRVVALPGANVPLLALGVRLPAPISRRVLARVVGSRPGREVAVAAAPPPRRGARAVGGRVAQRRRCPGRRALRGSHAGQRCSRRPRRCRRGGSGAGGVSRGGPGTGCRPRRRVTSPTLTPTQREDTVQTLEIEIRNPNGLHLRPLGQFVRTCGRTRSDVTIQNLATGAGPVNAKQMLRVQPLGVRMGHRVRITAEGEDEVEAIATIRAAIESGLGEDVGPATPGPAAVPPAPAPPTAASVTPAALTSAAATASTASAEPPPPADPGAGRLVGLGAVAGIAVAPAWRYREQAPEAATPPAGDPGAAIRAAAVAAEAQLEALAARIRDAGRPDDAGIFEAQAVLATDPTIVDEALARVAAGADPATAVVDAAADAAMAVAGLADETLAARAADVRDVGARIARILRGETLALPDRPVIAIADDLPPSVTAEIPAAFLLGIALAGGSRTAHAVILARGLGIPCVVGCAGLVEAVDAAAGGGGGGRWRSPSTASRASF